MLQRLVVAAVLMLILPSAHAQDTGPGVPLEMENKGTAGQAEGTRTLTLTATVMAVDVPNRTITLQTKSGEAQTFGVGSHIMRLSEVAVGDMVTIDYKEELTLKLQSASAESVTPQAVVVSGGNARPNAPGGGARATVQSSVRVAAINRTARTVVLEDPNGKRFQVRAGSNVNLEMLRVGDKLLATSKQSVAVNLAKPQE